jgi:hypothetical protein
MGILQTLTVGGVMKNVMVASSTSACTK